ncbi:hypothetical protein, partial [Escherichia coli]|uniref:hypothetical protein n=1 Tax=Escherichia coli TaxID=562 RepID=UPI0030F3D1EB
MLDDGLITYRSQLTAAAAAADDDDDDDEQNSRVVGKRREEEEEGSGLLLARTIQYTVLWYRHSSSTSLAVQPVRAAGG